MNEIPASDLEFGIFLGIVVLSIILAIHSESISIKIVGLFKRTKPEKDTDTLRVG